MASTDGNTVNDYSYCNAPWFSSETLALNKLLTCIHTYILTHLRSWLNELMSKDMRFCTPKSFIDVALTYGRWPRLCSLCLLAVSMFLLNDVSTTSALKSLFSLDVGYYNHVRPSHKQAWTHAHTNVLTAALRVNIPVNGLLDFPALISSKPVHIFWASLPRWN